MAATESSSDPRASAPTGIELDRAGRRLRFQWADGRTSDYEWEYLRWHCPCAHCQGEGDYQGELATKTLMMAGETQMVDVDLVGRYAVKPTWEDGHHTGIYTFRSLRQLAEQDNLLGPGS